MDYLAELNNIKEWIKNLVIIQYRQSKKNRALIDLLVELIFANNLILQIRDLCLSVDKSEGVQLDVVGKWVGIDRFYDGMELWNHPYLSFFNYPEIPDLPNNFDPSDLDPNRGGFSTYLNFSNNDGGFLTYKVWQDTRTADNQLGDYEYRELIKLKIIKNSINHTQANIDKAIWYWAGGSQYYSLVALSVGSSIYLDKSFNDVYGKVSAISANNITIVDNNNNELYKGYYNYDTTSETINGIENTIVYNYNLGHVYTTWTFKLYSASAISASDDIYQADSAEDFINYILLENNNVKTYGIVSAITANNITIENSDGLQLYDGYYEYTTVTRVIEGTSYTIYEYSLGNPMEVTYHYDNKYKDLMTLAEYKDVLPSPTGCKIVKQQIV